VRLLFVKPSLVWPRSSGHDVHTFYTMKACAELGHEIGLVTGAAAQPEAVAGLPLAYTRCLDAEGTGSAEPVTFSRLQERFRSYWGTDVSRVAALRSAVRAFAPDAVVVVGLDSLPFFAGVTGPVRIWYAADEWIWHHLSLVQPLVPATYMHLKAAAVKGSYERAYAPLIDRAWVVSNTERRAMRWLAGVRNVDVVPNGVDAEHYAPDAAVTAEPRTAVFWGRLDFEPNVQGLQWFCQRIWPAVRLSVPDARFTIIGFKPGPEVRALTAVPGVSLEADLPDLRAAVQQRAVVVLPFVSGGGIKNKLLEAAAMGLPIVCTARALSGLTNAAAAPIVTATAPHEWVEALTGFWSSPDRRRQAGQAGRAWVAASHTWRRGVEAALVGLSASLEQRRQQ
jgi:glycosyltransferase involved in cell wall biosynthesis